MDSSLDNIVTTVSGMLVLKDGEPVENTGVGNMVFTFSEKTWKEDLTLIVEGKKLFVNKSLLAIMSPVFCKMFEADFKEKSQDELELPEKKYADVLEFLRCIYPNVMRQVTENNVLQVVPLADEYQMQDLMTRCETCLLTMINGETSTEDLLKHLAQSNRYNLSEIKQRCLKFLSEKGLGELVDEEEKGKVPFEAKHDLMTILNQRLRHELKETRQLKEFYERKQHMYNYILSGFNKSDVRKMREFEDADGICIKLTFNVEGNVVSLSRSPTVTCKGFNWSVQAAKQTEGYFVSNQLFVNLKCESLDLSSPCHVKARAVLINRFKSKENVQKCDDFTFYVSVKERRIDLLPWSDFANDTAGFVIDNKANIDMYLLVK